MKKLFIKSALYVIFILMTLEVIVRFFHLYPETPIRYIDEFNVEKSTPGQTGFSVTGNRRQNYSEYKINSFGFNSFREFTPSENKIEVALIGDSFIEGFHQNYYNSTGKKIENNIKDIEIYEYGYSGYDLSNQLFLVDAYKTHFEKIDYIIFYLKYENDLTNNSYTPNHQRIALLKSTLFKIRNKSKLLSYASSIGLIDPIKERVINLINGNKKLAHIDNPDKDLENLKNFKTLIDTFGFDKNKMAFLLNSRTTNPSFIKYCIENKIEIIDFHAAFKNTTKPPTLIYDMHWNDHGREIIAKEISNFLEKKIY